MTAEGVNIRRRPLGRLAMALLVGIGLVGIVLLVAGTTLVPGSAPSAACSSVAVVMAAGTLAGMSAFQQGATERAVYSLAATWAIVMMTATGWLIPMGEPYRTSRVLGEKLAALAAKLNVEPVLLEYQEPGVVYALGTRSPPRAIAMASSRISKGADRCSRSLCPARSRSCAAISGWW